MKRKILKVIGIVILITLLCTFIGLVILAYGYGGGKAVRPAKPNQHIIDLENKIKTEVKSDIANIETPRNYELENCNKHGFQQQEVLIYIDNNSLKNEKSLETYILNVNQRLQKIFPYDKKCYDSVIIQTQYFDTELDSTINKRFSFPMIK